MADRFALLTQRLFDPFDVRSTELAWADHDHPAWPLLEPQFRAVELDSTDAEWMRERHNRDTAGDSPKRHSDADQWEADLRSSLQAAVAGDVDAFVRVCLNLRLSVVTLLGDEFPDGSLAKLPGTPYILPTFKSDLRTACQTYLAVSKATSASWLGTSTWVWREWAGYLALEYLIEHHGTEELVGVEWARWVNAIVGVWVPSQRSAIREQLVVLAADHEPLMFTKALNAQVRGDLARGSYVTLPAGISDVQSPDIREWLRALQVELTDALAGQSTANGMLHLEDNDNQHTHALELWSEVLSVLGDDGPAVDELQQLVACHPSLELRGRAAVELLRRGVDSERKTLLESVAANHDLGRGLIARLAREVENGDVLGVLSPLMLADLYRAACVIYPPDSDPETRESGFVTQGRSGRDFRDSLLSVLAARSEADPDALRVLSQLAEETPGRLRVRSAALQARRVLGEHGWHPPAPADLLQLLQSASNRLVRSDEELQAVVQGELRKLEAQAQQIAHMFWRDVEAGREPNSEPYLAQWIAYALKQRLPLVVVNTESIVGSINPAGTGKRTDIRVEATAPGCSFMVIIEAKGIWNPDLTKSIDAQLCDYLDKASRRHGIYLVLDAQESAWTAAGRRQTQARRNRRHLDLLDSQAAEAWPNRGKRIACHRFIIPA